MNSKCKNWKRVWQSGLFLMSGDYGLCKERVKDKNGEAGRHRLGRAFTLKAVVSQRTFPSWEVRWSDFFPEHVSLAILMSFLCRDWGGTLEVGRAVRRLVQVSKNKITFHKERKCVGLCYFHLWSLVVLLNNFPISFNIYSFKIKSYPWYERKFIPGLQKSCYYVAGIISILFSTRNQVIKERKTCWEQNRQITKIDG